VINGKLDPVRLAQAEYAGKGAAPFSFHEFGTGNNLTGQVDDQNGPARALRAVPRRGDRRGKRAHRRGERIGRKLPSECRAFARPDGASRQRSQGTAGADRRRPGVRGSAILR
jgi:hypothetical protein